MLVMVTSLLDFKVLLFGLKRTSLKSSLTSESIRGISKNKIFEKVIETSKSLYKWLITEACSQKKCCR